MNEADNQASQQAPQLLTVEEYARLLKVSRTTVFGWLKTGEILEGVHYIRLGRVLRFRWQLELLFWKKKPFSTKQPSRKRPTSSRRKKPSAEKGINLEYGFLTLPV